MITLEREPARIGQDGWHDLSGFGTERVRYLVGRAAVAEYTPELMRTAPGVLSVDIETAGKDGRKRYDIKCIGISNGNDAVLYDPRDPMQYKLIQQVLNEGDYKLVYHNSVFDVPPLHAIGVLDLDSIWRTVDTLLYARLAEPDERSRKDLHNTANRYLGMQLSDPLKDILKALNVSIAHWYMTGDLNIPAYRIMAATDPILTHRLLPHVKQAAFNRLTTGHPFIKFGLTGEEALKEIEKPQILNRQHLRRSARGFKYDPEYLDDYRDTTAQSLAGIEEDLEALGIRPGNSADLIEYLNNNDLLPKDYPVTKKTRRPSTAKAHLDGLSVPVAQQFVAHKEITHILRDYLDKVNDNADPDGRIHPVTNFLGARTGRQSISGDAPLHQFSGPARGIILADNWEEAQKHREHEVLDSNGKAFPCTCKNPKGLTSIDWSQIEPVITANIAGDVEAVKYYEEGNKFYDVLTKYGISYSAAKTTLLAQLYGEGIQKLARDLRVTQGEAERIRDTIWKILPGTQTLVDKPWKGGRLQSIAETYRLVFTLSGRIVPISSGMYPCWGDHQDPIQVNMCRKCDEKGMVFKVATHTGVNYFVQGSAYDLLAEAELKVIEAGYGDQIYFAMHDELIVDAEVAPEIRKIMETPPERLCMLAKRTPKLRTDMAHLGERWIAT